MTFFAFCTIYLDTSDDILYNIVDTVSGGVFNATTMFTSVEDLQAKIAEWELLEAYDFRQLPTSARKASTISLMSMTMLYDAVVYD